MFDIKEGGVNIMNQKKNMITFENENARLIFQEIRNRYPSLDLKGQPLTEEQALAMYYHAQGLHIPVINNKQYIPVYNIIAC